MTGANCYKLVNRSSKGQLLSVTLSTSLGADSPHAIAYGVGVRASPRTDCGRLAVFESADAARRFLSRCMMGKKDAPELYAASGEDLRKARGPAADLYLSLDGGRRKLLPNDFLPPGTLTARSVTLIERVPL